MGDVHCPHVRYFLLNSKLCLIKVISCSDGMTNVVSYKHCIAYNRTSEDWITYTIALIAVD